MSTIEHLKSKICDRRLGKIVIYTDKIFSGKQQQVPF